MNQPPEGKNTGKFRILVVSLDWGLGHATRCLPLISQLVLQGCEVWLAGEGAQQKLLQQEFPDLPFLTLEGYHINYARSATGLLLSIFRQTHKILRAIKKESSWLKEMVKQYSFDGVVSDNRYGLYHSSIPCIFITHQLMIKSPLGKWTEKILQQKNYQYINRFTECWVPDTKGENSLAGELSHPEKMPAIPVRYTGLLSRFHLLKEKEKKGHLLFILSGPEPQRTILENKIIDAISHYDNTATIVRGMPGETSLIPSSNMIRFFNHLPAEALNREMMKAEYVISRSGYSTVMDIVKLQKKSILIPTPGQTEQEYLAAYLLKKQIAYCMAQKDFSLLTALQNARQFSYQVPDLTNNENELEKIISAFIASLKK